MSEVGQYAQLPEIAVIPRDNERLPVVIHGVGGDDLAPFWPLPASTTQLLTPSSLNILSSPETALQGTSSFSPFARLVGGVHAVQDAQEQLVGLCYVLAPEHHIPGVGIYLLRGEMFGRGIGKAAVHGMTTYIFERLEKDAAQGSTLTVNEASRRMLLGSGFIQAPRKPEPTMLPYGGGPAVAELQNFLVFKDNDRVYGPEDFKIPSPSPEAVAQSRRAFLEQQEHYTTTIAA